MGTERQYPRWAIDAAAPLAYWSVVVVALLAAAAVGVYRRGLRGPALALAYYAVTIFPALGFVSFYPMRFSFVADHFQYLASLGVIALVVAGAAKALRRRRLGPALAAAVLVGLGALTWFQSLMYRDAQTLWTWTIKENPQAWIAHNNLGALLRDLGHYEEADECFRATLAIKPDLYEAYGNLGDSLERQGRYEEALRQFQRAVEEAEKAEQAIASFLHPGRLRMSVHYRLRTAAVLARLDRLPEAERWYRSALERAPDHPAVHLALAALYARLGRFDDAIGAATEALTLARAQGRKDLEREIEERIAAYRAGQ